MTPEEDFNTIRTGTKLLAITSQIRAKEGNHLQEGNLRIKHRSASVHMLGGFVLSVCVSEALLHILPIHSNEWAENTTQNTSLF